MRWDPPPLYHPPEGEESETSVEHGLALWAEPAVGYCSRRPRPSPMWGSRFVGARAVGPWLGEQKPLGNSPLRGNPSPESTYLPTYLFTGVPAPCVVLRVRCPGPLGSCSLLRPLGTLVCLGGVLGPLDPVHQCAARCVVLRVRRPGPLGSCSLVCPLGVLCCVCGVLGHLAPVQRCARSVCCVACTVSWASWLLFTGVPARCVVLRVQCPGPLGFCSPVCSLGLLCWVCAVLGHMAPVLRCARSVCCAVGCVCGASLRAAHSSIRTAAVRSRQGLGTLRARTRPSGRQLFRSRQGLGTLRALTRPSGWRLFRSRQGLGSLPDAHSSVRTAADVAWHLFWCRGSVRVMRALRVCGGRRPLLLGTCPCALVVAGGVPLWRASWPRVVRRALSGPVRSLPVLRSAFPMPWCLSPSGGLRPGLTGWLHGARGGRPRTGLDLSWLQLLHNRSVIPQQFLLSPLLLRLRGFHEQVELHIHLSERVLCHIL